MKRGAVAAAVFVAAALIGWREARRSTPEPRAKLAELEDILRSRNDNDPRLDSGFLGLSADEKRLFREKYAAIPPERRNERGTIVYLLGRNLTAPEDWEFMRSVAAEAPCLSLADCAKASGEGAGPGDEVTLAYPSLVALRQAARAVDVGAPRGSAAPVFEAGKSSRSKVVVRLAGALDAKH